MDGDFEKNFEWKSIALSLDTFIGKFFCPMFTARKNVPIIKKIDERSSYIRVRLEHFRKLSNISLEVDGKLRMRIFNMKLVTSINKKIYVFARYFENKKHWRLYIMFKLADYIHYTVGGIVGLIFGSLFSRVIDQLKDIKFDSIAVFYDHNNEFHRVIYSSEQMIDISDILFRISGGYNVGIWNTPFCDVCIRKGTCLSIIRREDERIYQRAIEQIEDLYDLISYKRKWGEEVKGSVEKILSEIERLYRYKTHK